MRNVFLVARRELQAGVTKRSFVVTTAIMVALLMVGIFVLDYFVNDKSAQTNSQQVAFENEASPLMPGAKLVADAHGLILDPLLVTDTQEGELQVSEGDAVAFVSGKPPHVTITFKSAPDPTIIEVFTQTLQDQEIAEQVTALGGDPVEFAQALSATVPSVTVLEGDVDDFGPHFFLAITMSSLLLFGLAMSGSIISMGVIEEKSSRVVEILLATIRPTQLFAGKVLGAGLIGLLQLLIYSGAIFVAAKISGLFDGFEVSWGASLFGMFGWFILGFAAIGTLWGALSALVSRQEDVGPVTAPMLLLTMIPFYVGIYLAPNAPDSSWTTNLSMAPFFAAFVMPIRQVFVDVPFWQLALAVALNVAVIPVIVWIAGTVYKRSVLHSGARMKLREVFSKKE